LAEGLVEVQGVLADLIGQQRVAEAAVRSGALERAAAALAELRPRARANGTRWALGLEAVPAP